MTLAARAVALAANRPCPRLDRAATAGYSDAAMADHHGHRTKQPRLAYALGKAFERRLTEDHEALHKITGATGDVVTIPDEYGDSEAWQKHQDLTATGQVGIILQGVAPGPFGGWLRPDIVFRGAEKDTWHVGEIKVYLDRGGETDPHTFGQAVTQAAASVLTLREAGYSISSTVLIVLTDLLGNPRPRWVDCEGEVNAVTTLRERAPYRGDATTPPPLEHAQHIYSIRCVGRCALADYCRDQLTTAGVRFPSMGLPAALGATQAEIDHDRAVPGSWTHAGYTTATPLLPTETSQ